MAVGLRRVLPLFAALVAAVILIPAGSSSTRTGGIQTLPTLYVKYQMNCTFAIFDDSGKPVTSIAPGTYQLDVSTPMMFKLVRPGGVASDSIAPNDYTGCKGWVQFELTGPGVLFQTTLDSGCNDSELLPSQTFKPSSTYNAFDGNQPTVAKASFTTTATGTPIVPKNVYGNTKGSYTQQQLAGINKVLGTLSGSVSSSGKVSLTTKGKALSTLKAGKYTFAISDKDAKAGLTIQLAGAKPQVLTPATFVGSHRTSIRLAPGRWMYSSGSGKGAYFVVTN